MRKNLGKFFLIFSILILGCEKIDVPNLTLRELNGKRINLRELKRPLMLYIWTGTCTGHTRDLRYLNKNGFGKFNIVSLSFMMTREDLLKTLKGIGVYGSRRITFLYDERGEISKYLNLYTLPMAFLYDKRGKLIKVLVRVSP